MWVCEWGGRGCGCGGAWFDNSTEKDDSALMTKHQINLIDSKYWGVSHSLSNPPIILWSFFLKYIKNVFSD